MSRQMRAVRGNTGAHLNLLAGQQRAELGRERGAGEEKKSRCAGPAFSLNDTKNASKSHHARALFHISLPSSPSSNIRPAGGAGQGRRTRRDHQNGGDGGVWSTWVHSNWLWERHIHFLNKVALTWASLYAHPISIGLWEQDLGHSHKINDRSMINGSISNPDC